MSHNPERKEKNCLNCGTEVQGRYCQNCGQENVEPKESFWHLITHFFNDFTHFDGKFFSTLKYLLLRPGFLTAEYVKGRRASYLHPIRMYVFTSALFFIFFFWLFSVKKIEFNQSVGSREDSVTWKNMQNVALKEVKSSGDSARIRKAVEQLRGIIPVDSGGKRENRVRFTLDSTVYNTIEQYDSVQKSLPADKRDGWFKRRMRQREITISNTYKGDRNQFWSDVINNFIHQFPKMFFISLPLFALILKLLYVRRKQFYYADHGIFAVHLYIFGYVLFLVFFGIQKLDEVLPSAIWSWIEFGLFVYWLYYTYKAMRNFYRQGRAKTLVKYLLLNSFAFVIILILFSFFFSYSVLEM